MDVKVVLKWGGKKTQKKKKVVQQDLILDWHQVKSNTRKAIFEGVTTNLYTLRKGMGAESLCCRNTSNRQNWKHYGLR